MPTFDTSQPIAATIELAMGDIRISAGERATTRVDVRPSDAANPEDVKAADQTRIEYLNDRLLVKAPKLRSLISRSGGGSVDVTIELPAGSSVHGAAASAGMQSDGTLGECRFKTGLGDLRIGDASTVSLKSGVGDVSVDRATGHAELSTGSGEIRARALDESAVIKNSNGDTWIGVAKGELRVNAANGSIAVDEAHSGVVAKSSNGDVRVGEVVRGAVVLETAIGDLEVGIREGTSAWLDVNASAGKVRTELDAAEAPESSADKVEVRARTSVGNIAIRRP